MKQVISLYDYTGEALRPWAEAGYECFAYDIQHDGERTEGNITYVHADLYDNNTLLKIVARHNNRVVFMSAFPPCTDLCSAGSRWWKDKGAKNPRFQHEATWHVVSCSHTGCAFGSPFYIENPVGALTRLWRSPDFRFDPYEYGGYLPEDDAHPEWPDIIPPRDAYRKRTCLWTGGSFRMPNIIPVTPLNVVHNRKDPTKGKNIRSSTPRGFAMAVYAAHA